MRLKFSTFNLCCAGVGLVLGAWAGLAMGGAPGAIVGGVAGAVAGYFILDIVWLVLDGIISLIR